MMERKAYTAYGEMGFGETGRHPFLQLSSTVLVGDRNQRGVTPKRRTLKQKKVVFYQRYLLNS